MKPYRFKITADGKTLTVEAKMLVIANGDKYGTGAFINPTSKIDDGWMEIIAVNPSGFDEIASLSIDMFKGVVDESEYVHIWKVKEADIMNLDKADFQIDGEVIPNTSEIRVICKANKFNFFAYDPEDEQKNSSR
jgi:diacylglycerol kinase family enzyme